MSQYHPYERVGQALNADGISNPSGYADGTDLNSETWAPQSDINGVARI